MSLSATTLAYKPLAACLRARGVVDAWLERCGLAPEALDDLSHRIELDGMRRIWREAVALTDEPRIGLLAGQHLDPTSFDVFGHLALAQPTLGEAVRKNNPFIRLVNELWNRELEVDGNRARLVQRSPSGVALLPQMNEYALSLMVALSRAFAGDDLAPHEIHLMHTLDDGEPDSEHRRVFRCNVRFGMPNNTIVFDASVLDRRLRSADPSLAKVLERYVAQLAAARPAPDRVSDNVRRHIAEALPDDASAKAIAKRMAMSERTLRRKLSAEDTSHSALLDQVRRELAQAYLDQGHSAGEVAEQLGYFDTSALHKAIKRWHG